MEEQPKKTNENPAGLKERLIAKAEFQRQELKRIYETEVAPKLSAMESDLEKFVKKHEPEIKQFVDRLNDSAQKNLHELEARLDAYKKRSDEKKDTLYANAKGLYDSDVKPKVDAAKSKAKDLYKRAVEYYNAKVKPAVEDSVEKGKAISANIYERTKAFYQNEAKPAIIQFKRELVEQYHKLRSKLK